MKNALLFDDNLGFLFLLADALCADGYQAYPAENATDAALVMVEVKGVLDLAIVNPAMPHAASLVNSLANAIRPPKILALEPESVEFPAPLPGAIGWILRPGSVNQASLAAWREELRQRLTTDGYGHALSAATH